MKTVPSSAKPSKSALKPVKGKRTPAELVDRALCVGHRHYGDIASKPGVRLSTHGLLEHIQISEAEAMRYVCATVMNHARQLMQVSFESFHGSRREIAHALLLAESLGFKAGEGFVVADVNDFDDSLTDAQLFDTLCESVESWPEFMACLEERNRQQHEVSEARKAHEAEARIAEARRSLQSLLESGPQVAA